MLAVPPRRKTGALIAASVPVNPYPAGALLLVRGVARLLKGM